MEGFLEVMVTWIIGPIYQIWKSRPRKAVWAAQVPALLKNTGAQP